MSVLTERVCRTIDRYGLFAPGARLLVAASGGADSTALVCLLREVAPRLGIELAGLAHFNHRLRGDASDTDEQFCRTMAGRFALGFEVGRADVRHEARRLRTSVEDAGRRLRYEFFAEAMARLQATHVAVGHTRDDQAETLLLNLLRGAGAAGLAGMPSRRGAIVRPLLDCSHQDLVEWLAAAGIPFREDESNRDRRYLRNRVRHDVIPALVSAVPSAVQALARAADITRAEDEYLDRVAAEAFRACSRVTERELCLDAQALVGMPLAVARRVALLALRERSSGRYVGFQQVERLLALAAGRVKGPLKLPGQLAEQAGTGQVVFTSTESRGVRVTNRSSPSGNYFRAPLSIPGEVLLGDGRSLSCELRPGGLETAISGNAVLDRGTAVLDRDQVSALAVRYRRPGDRFRPLGLGGHKTLQDLFVDRKVPRGERDHTPLVVDRDDRIVWVAGHVISEDFRVSERTRAVVILKLRGERD